jgi:uncharacterized protein
MTGGLAMSYTDVDSLSQYETDARQGRADALYNLGLAYSTGQGVGVDFVAAHKWFNLAALRGSDEAKSWRAQISREMLPTQIAEAQRLAREWLRMFH